MTYANNVELLSSISVPILQVAKSLNIGKHDALTSREDGARFYEHLIKYLDQKLPVDGLLRLNFDGVWLMDASFADESFVKLGLDFARGEFKKRYLLLEKVPEVAYENLVLAAESKPMRDSRQVRNVVLPILKADGQIEVIGKLEEHLSAPLKQVRSTEKLTARDLALALSLEVSAASTKLKTLYDLRLLRRDEIRDESGKQYIYRFFV